MGNIIITGFINNQLMHTPLFLRPFLLFKIFGTIGAIFKFVFFILILAVIVWFISLIVKIFRPVGEGVKAIGKAAKKTVKSHSNNTDKMIEQKINEKLLGESPKFGD